MCSCSFNFSSRHFHLSPSRVRPAGRSRPIPLPIERKHGSICSFLTGVLHNRSPNYILRPGKGYLVLRETDYRNSLEALPRDCLLERKWTVTTILSASCCRTSFDGEALFLYSHSRAALKVYYSRTWHFLPSPAY